MFYNSAPPNHRTLFESESVNIYYNFLDNWIYTKWLGTFTLETAKVGGEQILISLKSELCHKILVDQIGVNNIFSPAMEWVITDFAPRIAKAGLEYLAWVNSTQQFNRLSTDVIINHLPPEIMGIAFESLKEAKDWLRYMKSKEE